MIFTVRILLSVLVTSILTSCVCKADKAPKAIASGSQKASMATPAFLEIADWLSKNRMTVSIGQEGRTDYDGAFAQGAIIAYGEGSPAADSATPAQKRLTAIRAAEVVAQRNLAEFLAKRAMNGKIHFSNATVKLEAFLKGAVLVASEYDSLAERAAVLVKLDLNGVKGFSQ